MFYIISDYGVKVCHQEGKRIYYKYYEHGELTFIGQMNADFIGQFIKSGKWNISKLPELS